MENQKQETELKLGNNQLQSVIKDHLLHENVLNEAFTMFVNSLIYSERQAFLHEKTQDNKDNGYRKATRSGIGSKLQLKMPRDRLGVFQPRNFRETRETVQNLKLTLGK